MTQAELADHFLVLHRGDGPLLMPNAWDRGSAVLLASLGYTAIATTSSGFAATLGRLDGTVTREEALAHAGDLVDATPLPVSADLENGFAEDPAEAAATVAEAVEVGLAGCSIEDYSGRADDRIYDIGQATERVAAAAEAAHAGPVQGFPGRPRRRAHQPAHGQADARADRPRRACPPERRRRR